MASPAIGSQDSTPRTLHPLNNYRVISLLDAPQADDAGERVSPRRPLGSMSVDAASRDLGVAAAPAWTGAGLRGRLPVHAHGAEAVGQGVHRLSRTVGLGVSSGPAFLEVAESALFVSVVACCGRVLVVRAEISV